MDNSNKFLLGLLFVALFAFAFVGCNNETNSTEELHDTASRIPDTTATHTVGYRAYSLESHTRVYAFFNQPSSLRNLVYRRGDTVLINVNGQIDPSQQYGEKVVLKEVL